MVRGHVGSVTKMEALNRFISRPKRKRRVVWSGRLVMQAESILPEPMCDEQRRFEGGRIEGTELILARP